jgi:hypothetical protein
VDALESWMVWSPPMSLLTRTEIPAAFGTVADAQLPAVFHCLVPAVAEVQVKPPGITPPIEPVY